MKDQKKIRIVLLVVMVGLIGYSLVLWFLSYKTLETTVTVVEKTAAQQSKNFRYYVQEYQVTKKSLVEADQKIVDLTRRLADKKLIFRNNGNTG